MVSAIFIAAGEFFLFWIVYFLRDNYLIIRSKLEICTLGQ